MRKRRRRSMESRFWKSVLSSEPINEKNKKYVSDTKLRILTNQK